ncbi:MAG: hypothetical protein JXR13_02170 [Thalassovita sp.]
MRFLWRWLRRAVLALCAVAVLLLMPIAYVETACRGEALQQEPYRALLPTDQHRAEARTLMTYPEWHIVHAYDDYARVIKEGDPHQFAYLRAITGFWSSLCALNQAAAGMGGVDGGTKQMVYVIGVSFTAELLLKAGYEETLGRIATLARGAERTQADEVSARQAAEYAAFLQQVPWYKWDFQRDATEIAAITETGFRNRERRFALGTEYRSKSAYAGVIANAVANVGADALQLRLVVQGLDLTTLALFDEVSVIEDTANGVVIETPRYRKLTYLLAEMAQLGGTFVEIAGNDDILLTTLADADTVPSAMFSFARQGYGDHRHLLLIKVSDLASTLRALPKMGLRLEHIHDY